ncbi:chromosome segregation ATPase [Mesorhizobium robiniae]|uniref:Chromosome segregation ATPase n=1 Tax=Mesorhizobium robiniae TaxID=559315 RepID=A0ABV2GT96_9HYPH
MVQSVLFFVLGFLCAGFLALMIAPAIWRRAVTLTRRRVEGSMPLTLAEIQAEKDRIRAEFAMSTRKLEMSVKSLREKTAEHLVEIGRGREALKELAVERKDKKRVLSELEAKSKEFRQHEDQLQLLSDRLAQTERALEKRALELKKLEHMYDDASFSSSNRQIELVARESELQKLADDISLLRGQRREAERRQQEIAAENKAAQDALKAEKKKTGELDKKVERLLATLADREDKLGRCEREIARLREKSKSVENASAVRLAAAQGSQANAAVKGDGIEKAIAKLDSDREQLEARLMALARENKRLKTDLAASKSGEGDDARRASAALRDQMSDLAAQVVALTAKLDGPESPIAKVLAAPRQPGSGERSLADRVRALQKAESMQEPRP